jgi:pyrroline-5-carboxylate reductase
LDHLAYHQKDTSCQKFSANTAAELRKNVTSPNGTTQAALEVFDQAQISQNIQAALAAAAKRSQELAQELSDSSK